MNLGRKIITVFEHQAIKLDQEIDGVKFDEVKLKSLQKYYGEKGVPYFTLIHKGVRFNEYVGVIQVGDTTIEVLPKADYAIASDGDKKSWRDILIKMLIAVGVFDTFAPSSSSLKLKSNSILDLYFELFINEVEYLLHNGLVKQYRKKEGNVPSLKGRLQFGKHIQQNQTHQERFFVCYSTYDLVHQLHFILYKTIRLLKQINTNIDLQSRIGTLLLNFPEMPDMTVSDATFNSLDFSRKNFPYKNAINIAKLLLLQYHPDLSRGRNNVLALMFDMNKLWEQFVYESLRKHKEVGSFVTAQTSKYFWKPDKGLRSKIRPDIVCTNKAGHVVVLDTKWKNLSGYSPSPDDLRQMYVYLKYYGAKRVALVYPGKETSTSYGVYLDPITSKSIDKECHVISISVEPNIRKWQQNICADVEKWMN